MSACSASAMSQVGCRLMVASMANDEPARARRQSWGPSSFMRRTKSATSASAAARASGACRASLGSLLGAVAAALRRCQRARVSVLRLVLCRRSSPAASRAPCRLDPDYVVADKDGVSKPGGNAPFADCALQRGCRAPSRVVAVVRYPHGPGAGAVRVGAPTPPQPSSNSHTLPRWR